MTYGQGCETFHFAKRKIRFIFAVFGPLGPRNETVRSIAPPRPHPSRSDVPHRVSKDDPDRSLLALGPSFETPRFAVAPQVERGREKLRKRGVKTMKSLGRINWCGPRNPRRPVEAIVRADPIRMLGLGAPQTV
jgi:hypothetical protein